MEQSPCLPMLDWDVSENYNFPAISHLNLRSLPYSDQPSLGHLLTYTEPQFPD